MKNERIIDSWNKIAPDGAADARMLRAILARSPRGQGEKNSFAPRKPFTPKRLAPVAACLVLLATLAAAVLNFGGRQGGAVLVAGLGSGAKLSFYSREAPGSPSFAFDFDISARHLTQGECQTLFGGLPAVAYAAFHRETGAFLRLEGTLGDAKVHMAAPGVAITDTPLEGGEGVSEVMGTRVSAGYFITKANSAGVKNMIYFASFTLGDAVFLVELGGAESESEALRSALSAVIEQLIRHGARDLSEIRL